MKNRIFQIGLTLLCLVDADLLQAQAPDSLHFQRSIPALATFVTSDNLSNTYLISPENAIVKYDTVGRRVGSYTNNRLGQAAFLDASNPLKILVWYPDFQTVVLLDRTLSEMGRLSFSSIGLYSVRCAAMSSDGNIWAFDDAISKAVKLSLDGSVLLESPPLNIYFPQRFSATRIRDSGRFVCLNDPTSGWCISHMGVFDVIFRKLRDPRARKVLDKWLERDQCRWQESENVPAGEPEVVR